MTLFKTVTTKDGGCEHVAMSVEEEAALLAVQAAMQAEDARQAKEPIAAKLARVGLTADDLKTLLRE